MPDYLKSPTCWVLMTGSFVATYLLTPLVIVLARHIGVMDQGGYRKINARRVPLMGGLAIALPFLGVCLLSVLKPTGMYGLLKAHQSDFILLAGCAAIILTLGIVDDVRGLRARHKLLVQVLVGLLVCLCGEGVRVLNLPLLGNIQLGPWAGSLLTILWIVGVINAINLVDGIDGLASGLSLISVFGLGTIAMINGQTSTVLLCLSLAGSLAAFLRFNFSPARIFLGDTGSMFLGFMLAALAITSSSRASGSVMLLSPVLALGFPIFDTVTSMLRRLLRGRSPFFGDRAHTHHRLLDYGYSQRQVALILYAIALMCVFSGIISQIFYPHEILPLFAIGLYAGVVIMVAWVNGFLRLRHILRISMCHKRNVKFDAFTRWAAVAVEANAALDVDDFFRIGCKQLNLRFIEARYADSQAVIASTRVKEEKEENRIICDPVESIQVRDAAGEAVQIRYQLDHIYSLSNQTDEDARETDKLEHQDVMACLAHLFASIRISDWDKHRIIEPFASPEDEKTVEFFQE